MREPATVYLDAYERLEQHSRRLRELGRLLCGVGEVLTKDWKTLMLAEPHSAQLSREFAHPTHPHEAKLDDWPNADSLVQELESAHHTLAQVAAAWEAIPREWRALLPKPPVSASGAVKQRVA